MSTFTWIGGFPGTYNMTTSSNWSAGGPPGPADVALLQNTSSIGPYTLTGSLTVGELSVVGDIAALKGSITASGSFTTDLAITGGGQVTIASTGNFSGNDNIQVGATASPGLFVVDGILNTGQVDVFAGGTFEVDAPASVTGDMLFDTGTLLAIPTPGTAGSSTVTLGNAVHLLTVGTLGGSGGAALDLTGVIDGGGSIVVNGGLVALSGVNSFTGGVTVAAGTLIAASTALGSGLLTVSGGMLLASTSETITNAIMLQNFSTVAAAHGQTLTFTGSGNGLSGLILLGVPGDDGTIGFDLGPTGFSLSTNYVVQAGTVLEESSGIIGGHTLTVDAGATLDLNGQTDQTNALFGNGVLTNSGTAAIFGINGGSFSGTIDGAVVTDIFNAPTMAGTIDASAAGTIESGATLNLAAGGSIASAMVDNGVLAGVASGSASLSGAISGSGSIVINGGSVTLAGTNSFAGGVSVTAGTLAAAGAAMGSGPLTMNGGMLLASNSETISNTIVLESVATLAAAHGETLTFNAHPTLTSNTLGGTIFLGAPGDDGTIGFNLGPTGFGNPNYVVQAGTVLDDPFGMLGGYTLTVDAGATFDLNGAHDSVSQLTGNGVITNSGTAASLGISGGTFAGTIEGSVEASIYNSPGLAGTIDASVAGTVNPGATLNLVNGGSIASAMVDNGALSESVFFGTATVSGAISGSGSVMQVQSFGTLILSGNDDYTGGTGIGGGTVQVGNGGTSGAITGNVMDNGMLVFDRSDTISFAGTIGGGGGVAQAGSGTLALTGTNTFSGDLLLNAGVVELASGNAAGSGTIAFNAPSTLRLDTDAPANAIAGFGPGDTIDLAALAFTRQSDVQFVYSASTLDVIHSGTTVALTLPGTFTASSFTALTDGAGGTDIVACFAAGTRIGTDCGDVPVEALRDGDRMPVLFGNSAAPISWIGHRRIDCTSHPTPRRVWPVRIRAGAFGEHTPTRDLFLSADHAVFVSGVLIPIKHLINGTTIAQVPVDEVTYYHVELPRHDVLLAEGLPVESFLPGADSSDFANAGGAMRLHPDLASLKWEADGCAPLVVAGDRLLSVRHYLAERAETLGQRYRKRRRAA